MPFNSEEVAELIAALETYNDRHRGVLPPELQNQLATSSIKKLENLTALTFFTKQEFSIMALAVKSSIDAFEISGYVADSALLSLFERLISLSK